MTGRFLGQSSGDFFGDTLISELSEKRWHRLDVAVAWVQRSGLDRVIPRIESFLQRGEVWLTVGIALGHTSKEGLQALVRLAARHQQNAHFALNHDGRSIFHPKMYLFSNDKTARLFVGSNNLTGGGLYGNIEAAFEFTAPSNHPAIAAAARMLEKWRQETDSQGRPLALPLEGGLIDNLVASGDLPTELEVRQREAQSQPATGLFGRRVVNVPPLPGTRAAAAERRALSSAVAAGTSRRTPRRQAEQDSKVVLVPHDEKELFRNINLTPEERELNKPQKLKLWLERYLPHQDGKYYVRTPQRWSRVDTDRRCAFCIDKQIVGDGIVKLRFQPDDSHPKYAGYITFVYPVSTFESPIRFEDAQEAAGIDKPLNPRGQHLTPDQYQDVLALRPLKLPPARAGQQ